jgi:hypothetical protein
MLSPMSRFASIFTLFLLLSACGPSAPEYKSAPGLSFGAVENVDGRNFNVGRLAETDGYNYFYATAQDRLPAPRETAMRAIRRFARCDTYKFVEMRDAGITLVTQGNFCP